MIDIREYPVGTVLRHPATGNTYLRIAGDRIWPWVVLHLDGVRERVDQHALPAGLVEMVPTTRPVLLDAQGTRWTWMVGYWDEDGNGQASRAAIEDDEDARPVVEVEA